MAFEVADGWLHKGDDRVDVINSRYIGGDFARQPRIAVIHFTYGGSARSSAEWFRDPRNPGSSAHIVVDRDGHVIQCVPFGKVAWHAGKSRWREMNGLNSHSIGIELANWGYLKKSGSGWSCYTGTRIDEPFMAIHRNGNPDGSRQPLGWEPYPKAQFDAAVEVIRALVRAGAIEEIVGHDDIAPTRKWDPGPAFDMAHFKASVFGGRSSDGGTRMRVAVASGVNLRAGPGTQFAVSALLPKGTRVEPLAADGAWIEVTVLDAAGAPDATGWVHGRYVEDA